MQLPRRRGEDVLPSQDVRNAHVIVIHHHREQVRREAVRLHQHEVIEQRVLERHLPANQVGPPHTPLVRHAEAQGLGPALRVAARALLGREAKAGAIILGRQPRGLHLLATRREFLRGTVARIRDPPRHQFLRHLSVARQLLRLEVGTMRPAHLRPLVPVNAEPAQAVENVGGELV